MTRIYVVTPAYNAASTIDQTIASVVNQAGPFELHYHVQDGGSTDGTLERLMSWSERLSSGQAAHYCQGLKFTFESSPDAGMYDAIYTGFGSVEPAGEDWQTWINADDILAPGACALMAAIDGDQRGQMVSWVSGAAAVVSNGTVIAQVDRPLCADVIREGLCDGLHWDFVQQEGTFFRRRIWDAIDLETEFRAFKLAGDWNLWRNFAKTTELYQVGYPLGYFHERPGQLSQRERAKYEREIEQTVSTKQRSQALRRLRALHLQQRRLSFDYKTRDLQFPYKDLTGHLDFRTTKVFGEEDSDQSAVASDHLEPLSPEAVSVGHTDIIAHDADWQYPAITEAHAFDRAKALLPYVEGVCYLAFPWATFIDNANAGQEKAQELRQALEGLEVPMKGYKRVVTVCQHIHMPVYADVLMEAGVTDVFWSHAVKGQSVLTAKSGKKVRIHPFPLYPVQALKIDRHQITAERPLLFSFVGAKVNKWYLTQARKWILEDLASHPKGFVRGRDSWHYQKVVYDGQINRSESVDASLVDDDASKKFRELLLDSVFSLCPSGTGPNSIRLWESIGAGSIPVVLADTYEKPGNPKLWANAVLDCKEDPEAIRALPSQLQAIATDPETLADYQRGLDQLWFLYGPEVFISDILSFYLDFAGEDHAARTSAPPLVVLADEINKGVLTGPKALADFLRVCFGRLVVAPEEFSALYGQSRSLRMACEFAYAHCGEDDLKVRLVDEWRRQQLQPLERSLSKPVKPISAGKIRVHLYGRHANRTPLHYGPYRRLFEKHVAYENDVWKSDLLLGGFDIDIHGTTREIHEVVRVRPEVAVQIVSEEPLWDTVWSKEFRKATGSFEVDGARLEYGVANHLNSDVFKFDKIPYFLTTDDKFFRRYSIAFTRNSRLSSAEVLETWRAAKIRSAFFAERRLDDRYNVHLSDHHVEGLCVYRSAIAEAVAAGEVVRIGQGWPSAKKVRQSLPDWHLDKLTFLDCRAFIVSGLENTHHPDYITEKIFDSFATLAVPVYYASPQHRIHEICPDGGFINVYGMDVSEAAQFIDTFEPREEFAERYLEVQRSLANLFHDPATLLEERSRVVHKVLRAIG